MTTTRKPLTRKRLEALVWTNTGRDFRGKFEDGTKTILHNGGGAGTLLVTVSSLTDAELLGKLPKKIRDTITPEGDTLTIEGKS